MKVLLLHDQLWDERGGSTISVAALARGLSRAGAQVRVLTTSPHRARCGLVQQDGYAVQTIYSWYPARCWPWVSLYNPLAVGSVRRLVRRWRPEVVHAHNVHHHLSYAACEVAAQAGVPVVLTAHDVQLFYPTKWPAVHAGDFRNDSHRTRRIRALVNRSVRRILCVSQALQRAVAANGYAQTQVVYQGTDMADTKPAAPALDHFCARHALSGRSVLLHGGRISAAKGTGALLEAFVPIRRRCRRPLTLLLAGEFNGYRRELEGQCARLGFTDEVVRLGWVDRATLRLAYAAADVCVTPSLYFDPFNLMNIEAMACGKPVVGTCFGGAPEAVDDGATGYVVNPFDQAQLVDRLARLLEDPAQARTMGARGVSRVAAHFSVDPYVQRVLQIYGEVLRG